MKESTDVPAAVKNLCTRISAIKSIGGDYGLALYNELVSVDYLFTEDNLWFVADSIGYTENLFNAIICSKLVSSDSMFRMLQFVDFNLHLCWLAFYYDNSIILRTKVARAMQKKGLPQYKAFLKFTNNSPFDDLLEIHPVSYQPQAPCYHA